MMGAGLLSALRSNCNALSLSLRSPKCITYGLPLPWAVMSSMDSVEYIDTAIQMPYLAAARDVASSPSSCASLCMAAGANPRGKLVLHPNISPVWSTCSTLTNTRGRILYRLYASSLSRSLQELTWVSGRFANTAYDVRDQIHGAFIHIIWVKRG
jgi:hypothetical protein